MRQQSIFLLIRSLELGGAERQLVELAIGLHKRGQEVRVGVFYRRGLLAAELESQGIEIVDLRKSGRWDVVGFLARTVKALRQFRPDAIYSVLGGANVVAAAARPFVPSARLVWSVRSSNMDLGQYDWLHRASYRLECAISGMPDLIIANSAAGRNFAVANGFPEDRIEIVPNGIDTSHFRPNEKIRATQRRLWGLQDDDIAVGILARLDPMKDHATFLRAAARAAGRRPEMRFLCIGEGPERRRVEKLAAELGIAQKVRLTGAADAVAALNAIDIACSSSITEGFPNAVAEAMACGRPCVVTDVGDSALIVGGTGAVVPHSNPDALAEAILNVADDLDSIDPLKLRSRIVKHFSADSMVERSLQLLRSAALKG